MPNNNISYVYSYISSLYIQLLLIILLFILIIITIINNFLLRIYYPSHASKRVTLDTDNPHYIEMTGALKSRSD